MAQGYGMLSVGEQNYMIAYPYLADGDYKAISVGIFGQTITVLIDYLYKKVVEY